MNKQSYANRIRRYKIKTEAVKLLGGKCMRCEWSGNIAAFHFHHKNPKEKKFTISGGPTTNWEKYWEEVKKCELLCANCHSIHHSDYVNETFLMDVEKYSGRTLISSEIPWKNQFHVPVRINKTCIECKSSYETQSKIQKFCSSKCRGKYNRKVERPDKYSLEKLLRENSMVSVGKMFGVSDNAVRKWAKQFGILK